MGCDDLVAEGFEFRLDNMEAGGTMKGAMDEDESGGFGGHVERVWEIRIEEGLIA